MHTVIQTSVFLRSAAELGVGDDELTEIVSAVAASPDIGDVMSGTGGARKMRFAGRGKGKSGGYRIITFYAAADVPVFLLDIYGKGDKANLSQAERNALRAILSSIADAYRAGVRERVRALMAQRKEA